MEETEIPVSETLSPEVAEQLVELLNQLIQIELDRDAKELAEQEASLLQLEEDLQQQEELELLQQEEQQALLTSEEQFREDLLQALADLKTSSDSTYMAITEQQEFINENYTTQNSYLDNVAPYLQWMAVIIIVAGVAYPAIWVVKQISSMISSAFRIHH